MGRLPNEERKFFIYETNSPSTIKTFWEFCLYFDTNAMIVIGDGFQEYWKDMIERVVNEY